MPPNNAPSGIANRVSTRENPKTLPCIFDGTVSRRTVATIVFHAILQVIATPKAIRERTNMYSKARKLSQLLQQIGVKELVCCAATFSKGIAIKLPKRPPIQLMNN